MGKYIEGQQSLRGENWALGGKSDGTPLLHVTLKVETEFIAWTDLTSCILHHLELLNYLNRNICWGVSTSSLIMQICVQFPKHKVYPVPTCEENTCQTLG